MNNFYQEWKAYQHKYSVSHDVVCRVPLVGYFVWRDGNILRCEPSYEIPGRGNRHMGLAWKPSKSDLAAFDFSIEKATCTLFAIPFSGLHGVEELELMYGNGRGSFVAYFDSGLTTRAADGGESAEIDVNPYQSYKRYKNGIGATRRR